jgi:uncharacterized protein YggE
VSVVGIGEVQAAPDLAHTNVGVETRAPTAEQAIADANQRMTALINALKAAGIAESDLKTHSLSISFEPNPPAPAPVEAPRAEARAHGKAAASAAAQPAQVAQSGPDGYFRVSNMVEVTIRDLSKAAQVLATATQAGANQLWGISFEVANTEPLVARAREKAIAQAKQSAEQLAQLTGVKLGPILAITDGVVADTPAAPALALRAQAAGSAVPVEGGELTVSHQVTVLYALEPHGHHHAHPSPAEQPAPPPAEQPAPQ